ncbi:MAG: ShlB/FhaC/HecB family hemolysin secretion/activation protein [Rhizobacter sp.]|nr:ShlB/FhaC/HecB family hemolysin secretion/activation protein [Rhizobacter sp.]
MTKTSLRLALLAASIAAGFPAVPAFSQTIPPDAGQTLRELARPQPVAPRAAPSLMVPADADAKADTSQRFTVTSVAIEGNRLIATADLQPLVDTVIGREATLEELRQAARRITALYRERGFVVARAYVPAQALKDGVVRVTVLEGSLNSTTVQNKTIVRQDRLDAIAAAQQLEGQAIQSATMDRELLLMSDMPAVGAVSGYLKPGQAVGTSDLIVSADPGKPYEGDVSLDNYGNRYTGQTRLNGHLDVNSPLHLGDRLSLRGTVTEEKLLYGRVAYDLPVNSNGLRAGAAVSSSHYELGREFSGLDASGTATTAGVFASYPLLRGLNANVWLAGSLDYRKLKDKIESTSTQTDKNATAATVEAYGDLSDAWFDGALGGWLGGAYSTWHLTGVAGSLHIDSAQAQAIDAAGPQARGSYQKLQASLTRLQGITQRTSLLVALSGQAASKNLDSSEKWVLGGVYGIRAYPQGEGVGDQGWMANVELRQEISRGVQASAFYDAGGVTFNHDAYAAGANSQTLRGYGVALGGAWNGFNAKATIAWRDGQRAVTAPDHSPRLWLTAGWAF